jgi:hypothetical protein
MKEEPGDGEPPPSQPPPTTVTTGPWKDPFDYEETRGKAKEVDAWVVDEAAGERRETR